MRREDTRLLLRLPQRAPQRATFSGNSLIVGAVLFTTAHVTILATGGYGGSHG
jgi:hypothetical protein